MRENELSRYALDHSLQAANDFSGLEDHEINGENILDWDLFTSDFIEMLELADRNSMSL